MSPLTVTKTNFSRKVGMISPRYSGGYRGVELYQLITEWSAKCFKGGRTTEKRGEIDLRRTKNALLTEGVKAITVASHTGGKKVRGPLRNCWE